MSTRRRDVPFVLLCALALACGTWLSAQAPDRTVRPQVGAPPGLALPAIDKRRLSNGLPIWIDARVMARERVIVGGGSRSCKVLLEPSSLLALPGVEVVDGLAVPIDPPTCCVVFAMAEAIPASCAWTPEVPTSKHVANRRPRPRPRRPKLPKSLLGGRWRHFRSAATRCSATCRRWAGTSC